MSIRFSLAHLTVIDQTPPDVIRIAAETGYDAVGLRLLAVSETTPGYPLMSDARMLRETRQAIALTGIKVLDIEFVRITPGIDVASLEPVFAAGAELGARHILVAPYDPDLGRLANQLAEIAESAAQFGMTPVMEFFPWTPVSTLASARQVVEASADDRIGILVDTLHFDRSNSRLEDLQAMPASRLPYVHLCDAPVQATYSEEELLHAAREERLPPGQGAIELSRILEQLEAPVPLGLEVPMNAMRARLGAEAVARHVREVATQFLDEHALKLPRDSVVDVGR